MIAGQQEQIDSDQ